MASANPFPPSSSRPLSVTSLWPFAGRSSPAVPWSGGFSARSSETVSPRKTLPPASGRFCPHLSQIVGTGAFFAEQIAFPVSSPRYFQQTDWRTGRLSLFWNQYFIKHSTIFLTPPGSFFIIKKGNPCGITHDRMIASYSVFLRRSFHHFSDFTHKGDYRVWM